MFPHCKKQSSGSKRKRGECSYVNELLCEVGKELKDKGYDGINKAMLTANLTSHSFRHGAGNYLFNINTIQECWLNQRGNWISNARDASYNYKAYSILNDLRVARSLSQWGSLEQGGSMFMHIESELGGEDEWKLYLQYVKALMGPSKMIGLTQVQSQLLMSNILVMHFNEVYNEYGRSNLLINKMLTAYPMKVDLNKLKHWSSIMLNHFRALNAPYIPLHLHTTSSTNNNEIRADISATSSDTND